MPSANLTEIKKSKLTYLAIISPVVMLKHAMVSLFIFLTDLNFKYQYSNFWFACDFLIGLYFCYMYDRVLNCYNIIYVIVLSFSNRISNCIRFQVEIQFKIYFMKTLQIRQRYWNPNHWLFLCSKILSLLCLQILHYFYY